MCANSCSSQVPRLLATRDCASLHPNDKEHAIGSSSGGSSLRQFGFLWYVPGRKRENGLGLSYILGTDVTYRVVICSSKNTCLKSQDTLWLSKACWGFCYYYFVYYYRYYGFYGSICAHGGIWSPGIGRIIVRESLTLCWYGVIDDSTKGLPGHGYNLALVRVRCF